MRSSSAMSRRGGPSRLVYGGRELGQPVRVRVVDERVRGVEAEPVEAVLAQPVERAVQEKAADAGGVLAVEVHGAAPRRLVRVGKERAEGREVGAVGAEVVVDDVQKDREAEPVRPVHERAQVVRAAVALARREEVGAVVAPVAEAGEGGERQQFHRRHAERRELRELRHRRAQRALGREGAHVQLVQHEVAHRHAGPRRRLPRIGIGIDDLARPVDAVGLEAARGIGPRARLAEADAVARAGLGSRARRPSTCPIRRPRAPSAPSGRRPASRRRPSRAAPRCGSASQRRGAARRSTGRWDRKALGGDRARRNGSVG